MDDFWLRCAQTATDRARAEMIDDSDASGYYLYVLALISQYIDLYKEQASHIEVQ